MIIAEHFEVDLAEITDGRVIALNGEKNKMWSFSMEIGIRLITRGLPLSRSILTANHSPQLILRLAALGTGKPIAKSKIIW